MLEYIWDDSQIIILSGDIETNPGPKHSFSSQVLKICQWNLNRLLSHMYKKVYSLSAYMLHVCPQIRHCLSETYLNSKTSADDNNVEIPGYNIIRKITHLTLNMYYKDTLPFKLSNIKYLQECITFEIIIGIKCCKFLVSL